MLYAQGKYGQMYETDQKLAMSWIKQAWRCVTRETITNCFQHTTLFSTDTHTANGSSNDHTDDPSEEMTEMITSIHSEINDIKDIDLHPAEEMEDIHETFTDEDEDLDSNNQDGKLDMCSTYLHLIVTSYFGYMRRYSR